MKNLITLAFIAVAIIASSSKTGNSKDDGSDGRTKEYSSISKYFFPIFATVTLAFNAMTINSIEPSSLDKGISESPKEDPKEFEYSYKAEITDTPETQYINPWDDSSLSQYNLQDKDEMIILDHPEEMEEIEKDKEKQKINNQALEFLNKSYEQFETNFINFFKYCNDYDPFEILEKSLNEMPKYDDEKLQADIDFIKSEFEKTKKWNKSLCKKLSKVIIKHCILLTSFESTFILIKYLIENFSIFLQ